MVVNKSKLCWSRYIKEREMKMQFPRAYAMHAKSWSFVNGISRANHFSDIERWVRSA